MRIRTSLLSAGVALAMAVPAIASAAAPQHTDGWPKWIGRLNYALTPSASPARVMSQGPLYLPRSLVRTGAFGNILNEIRTTPGSTTTVWPEWVDEMSGN